MISMVGDRETFKRFESNNACFNISIHIFNDLSLLFASSFHLGFNITYCSGFVVAQFLLVSRVGCHIIIHIVVAIVIIIIKGLCLVAISIRNRGIGFFIWSKMSITFIFFSLFLFCSMCPFRFPSLPTHVLSGVVEKRTYTTYVNEFCHPVIYIV